MNHKVINKMQPWALRLVSSLLPGAFEVRIVLLGIVITSGSG